MNGINDFYAGRGVFITGATGFIGKVVVEKLLRSCPDVGEIYVLCRAKKDVEPQDRIDELMTQEVFERAKKEVPDCEKKVVAIRGDITEDGLGISDEDLAMLREKVSVIIHIAATIKFQEPIKVAANMNMISVQQIVLLAKSLKRCDALVHTSTAYAHTYQQNCPEDFIDPKHDPEQVLGLLNMMDDDIAAAASPELIKQHPNTYTFTKCLAEDLLKKSVGTLPTAVVRPSIVCPSWREPYPGWTDTFNGPPGLMTAAGTGLLRTVKGIRSVKCDIVPVDVVATTLVTAAWRTWRLRSEDPDGEIKVYNCTTGRFNPTTWGEWVDCCNRSWHKYPLEKRLLRSPQLTIFPSQGIWSFLYYYFSFSSHMVPGMMLDFVAKMNGKKSFTAKTYAKFENMLDQYAFFMTHEFRWSNDNLEDMIKEIPEAEKGSFRIDTRDLNWQAYIDTLVLGIKKYKMGEEVTERRLSKSRIGARNTAWRGLLVRMIIAVMTMRSLVSLGYIRGSRLYRGSTLALVLAMAVGSKQIRSITANAVH